MPFIISTWSEDKDGPGVVYFDDVYVLPDTPLCESDLNDEGVVDGGDLVVTEGVKSALDS